MYWCGHDSQVRVVARHGHERERRLVIPRGAFHRLGGARQCLSRVCFPLDDDHGPHHHQGRRLEGMSLRPPNVVILISPRTRKTRSSRLPLQSMARINGALTVYDLGMTASQVFFLAGPVSRRCWSGRPPSSARPAGTNGSIPPSRRPSGLRYVSCYPAYEDAV